MATTLLPLITLFLGFVASFLLELFRNRWTTQNAQQVRDVDRQQVAHSDRVSFERDGLRIVHGAVQDLLSRVNAIAIVVQKAETEGRDWRESDKGEDLRTAAMHANANCNHQSALLLHPPVIEAVERLAAAAYPMYWTRESGTDPSQNRDFYEAAQATTRAIASRLRELYGFDSDES